MKISDLLICRGSQRILTRDRKKFAGGLASSSYAFPDSDRLRRAGVVTGTLKDANLNGWLVAKDAPGEALLRGFL